MKFIDFLVLFIRGNGGTWTVSSMTKGLTSSSLRSYYFNFPRYQYLMVIVRSELDDIWLTHG